MIRITPRPQISMLRTLIALVIIASMTLSSARFAHASAPSSAALTVSKQALMAYRAKRYKDAAALYRAAWHTHRSELRYLYNAARAAQLAGFLKDSERDYIDYLTKATAESSGSKKARVHLEEVRSALRAQRAALPPKRTKPPPKLKPTGALQRAAGWASMATGVVMGLIGGFVLVSAQSDQQALQRRLAIVDSEKKIVGISVEESDAEHDRLATQFTLGWGVAGAGFVLLGVGALAVATAPTAARNMTLSPWPNGRGAGLTLRF